MTYDVAVRRHVVPDSDERALMHRDVIWSHPQRHGSKICDWRRTG
jgi:hypothetical protein